jgi:glycolate oxidase FAD binding subunit
MNDSVTHAARDLERTIGRGRVRLPHYESRAAQVIVEPENLDEAIELVCKCERDGIALAAFGAARTLAQLRPAPVELGISLAQLNHIVAYEPDDMTITVEAGMTLAALNAYALSHGQRLAVDPPRPELTTIGALIGGARSGPIRMSEGTVRDLLIGVRFIGHQGRLIHGGGSVVKNVAGYDLMKIMTGSHGTLGIITEATFKLRPLPANYTLACGNFATRAEALAAAMQLREIGPMVHLEAVSGAGARALAYDDNFVVMAGLAGSEPEVTHLCDHVTRVISDVGFIDGSKALATYERLRDFTDNETVTGAVAAEIGVPHTELPRVLEACASEFRAHVGNGVAQLFDRPGRHDDNSSDVSQASTAIISRWREAVHDARGILHVLRLPPEARAQVAIFDDPPPAAFKLMRRLKATFDPRGIFNPGSFVGGL